MIRYEWTVELLEGEDIVDSYFAECYERALTFAVNASSDCVVRIGVVRDRYDSGEDLVCRSWAYLEDGKLPERFEDAYGREIVKVPARFHKAVAA